MQLWKLIRSCLKDKECQQMVRAGQRVLDEIQDSLSEAERGERLGVKRNHGAPIKKTGLSTDLGPKEKRITGKHARGEFKRKDGKEETKKVRAGEAPRGGSLYPPLDEFKGLALSSSESDEELSPSEKIDLEEEAARYEGERYQPDERRANQSHNKPKAAKESQLAARSPGRWLQDPSVPPPNAERPPCAERHYSDLFIPKEEQRKMQQAFPVFEGAEGGCIHAPVEYIQIKELAESVRNYGVSANFTIAQVERLAALAMTPGDWVTVVKAAAPNMGMYLKWKALWQDFCQTQARANATMEGDQRTWTFELLTGQGQHAANQTNYHWGAYAQISAAAVKAWKALSRKGEASGHLTRITQGTQESFSDFVARMMEAAGRIFGDPEAAMPLIEQLVYEQATQECRSAITPRKSKGLQDWLKVCRELGGPLTNAGLAAAILQGRRRSDSTELKLCFNCGKPGHLKKDCRAPIKRTAPGLCTKCGKGYHWAKDCHSIRDIRGRLLQPTRSYCPPWSCRSGL